MIYLTLWVICALLYSLAVIGYDWYVTNPVSIGGVLFTIFISLLAWPVLATIFVVVTFVETDTFAKLYEFLTKEYRRKTK